jgi:hypothetical protein
MLALPPSPALAQQCRSGGGIRSASRAPEKRDSAALALLRCRNLCVSDAGDAHQHRDRGQLVHDDRDFAPMIGFLGLLAI